MCVRGCSRCRTLRLRVYLFRLVLGSVPDVLKSCLPLVPWLDASEALMFRRGTCLLESVQMCCPVMGWLCVSMVKTACSTG